MQLATFISFKIAYHYHDKKFQPPEINTVFRGSKFVPTEAATNDY